MSVPSPGEVVWRVRPLATPRVLRHCARCGAARAFVQASAFRMNAQQRRLDVWLLYRCAVCGDGWKRSLLRRVSRAAIAPDLLARLQRNDAATAWELACAPDPGLTLVPSAQVVVQRPPLGRGSTRIRLEVPWPCGVRLGRLLASELGLSRGALGRAVAAGLIRVEPLGARALARPPRDGTVLVLCDGARAARAPGG